ncbi:MAG: LPP20 family lipoprotein [Candidatus Magnetomorum sp.]|nr:LPP20 family lipoprotein [Candidatus Magnetomorum sp.]
MKIYSLLGCLFLLIGCSPANIPHSKDWFEPSTVKYPESRYLTATGFGESKESAQYRAKAELATIFESKIDSELKLETRAMLDSIKGEHSSEKIDSAIRIYSLVNLKGVQITEVKSTNGQYSALAVLDKIQAKENWLAELSLLDTKISADFESIQHLQSQILWIKPIQRIWCYWMERTSIASRLTVIGFKAPSGNFQIKSVLDMIARLKNSLRIHISISGKNARYLSDTIAKTLNNEGFILTLEAQKADVLISGNVIIEALDIKNEEWTFTRATVSLQIIDQSTGLQVGDIHENVRRGQLTHKSSAFKSIKDVSSSVQKRVLTFFDPLGGSDL